MARRVFLHIGTARSETAFLRRTLWAHRLRLQRAGLLVPGDDERDHAGAAAEVRELPSSPTAHGPWLRLLSQIREFDGDAVISHEAFASASRDQAATALEDLARVADEVDLVVVAKDLGRELPAVWQEQIEHRSTSSYRVWTTLAWSDLSTGPLMADGQPLWHLLHLPSLLDRWGHALPAPRVHVVTVPSSGQTDDQLWRRFAWLLGVEDVAVDLDTTRSHSSVGAEQSETLRRVNAALGDRLPLAGSYASVAQQFLAYEVLADRPGRPIRLHTEDHLRADAITDTFVNDLADAGYDVVGDLEELRCGEAPVMRRPRPGHPVPLDAPWHGLEKVDESRVLEEATEALAATLTRLAETSDELTAARAELTGTSQALENTARELEAARAELTEITALVEAAVTAGTVPELMGSSHPANAGTAGPRPSGSRGKGVLRRRR